MSAAEQADLARLAIFLYLVALPALIAAGMVWQAIAERRMRRRIERIMRGDRP